MLPIYFINDICNKLLENLEHPDINPGCIIASPSKKDPDYFYHWARDSALTCSTLLKVLKWTYLDPNYKLRFENILQNYILFEKHVLKYNLGEPKYHTDGTLFTEPWGRPQNDGPALKVLVAIDLYKYFSSNKILLQNLYQKDISKPSIIKSNLEFICDNYNMPSFDLWEEKKGFHFYTSYNQYIALCNGSKFAKNMDDYHAHKYYAEIAQKIKTNILSRFFIDGKFYSNLDEHFNPVREYDSANILLLTQNNREDIQELLNNPAIINNIEAGIEKYREYYSLNKHLESPWIGRYFNDVYYEGKPWILLTAGLGQYYKLFNDDLQNHSKIIEIKNRLKNYWVLFRNFAEQIDTEDLKPVSADHLTWSYCEVLRLFL
jgi:glucoamylase